MKVSILIAAVKKASDSALILLGWQDYLEIHSHFWPQKSPIETLRSSDQILFLGRRVLVLHPDRYFEIIEAPPSNVVDILYWIADLLEKSDKGAGNFSHGIAQSLRGRAIILDHVRKSNENNLEISSDNAGVHDSSAAPKRIRSGIGGAGSGG